MKIINEVLLDKITMAGAVTTISKIISLEHMYTFAIQFVTAGTTGAGTLQMQVSCQPGIDGQGSGVTDWTDLDAATTVPALIGSGLINKDGVGYKWLRLSYAANAGDGTITAYIHCKGN